MPGHIDTAHDLGVSLWDARALRIGLPSHELRHDKTGQEQECQEACEGERRVVGLHEEPSQKLLRVGEAETVERHDTSAHEAHQTTLPDHIKLEFPRKSPAHLFADILRWPLRHDPPRCEPACRAYPLTYYQKLPSYEKKYPWHVVGARDRHPTRLTTRGQVRRPPAESLPRWFSLD